MRHWFYITPRPHRVYVFGRHLHHGLDGLFLIVAGIALAIHDRHDWPWLPEAWKD